MPDRAPVRRVGGRFGANGGGLRSDCARMMFGQVLRLPLAAIALLPAPSFAAEAPSQRQAELLHLLQQDCGSCHGLTMKGGLGPALLPETLAGRDDAMLIETILDGRPGTPMPPWRFELNAEDAAWMVRTLKGGLR